MCSFFAVSCSVSIRPEAIIWTQRDQFAVSMMCPLVRDQELSFGHKEINVQFLCCVL